MKNKIFGRVRIEFDAWTPLKIANASSHKESYSPKYMITKMGDICVIDESGNARVCKKYWHNNSWYVDFYNNGEHINQSIRGLIFRSWGAAMAKAYSVMFENREVA